MINRVNAAPAEAPAPRPKFVAPNRHPIFKPYMQWGLTVIVSPKSHETNLRLSYVILSASWLTSYVVFCCVAYYLYLYIHSLYNTIMLKTNNYIQAKLAIIYGSVSKKKRNRKFICQNCKRFVLD